MTDSNSFADALLDAALDRGADAAEVFQSRSHARPVYFEANRLKQLESTDSEGTTLRLWHNGRPGLAVSYGPTDPRALVDRALAIAQLNPPEAIELGEAVDVHYPDLGIEVPIQQIITWAKESISLIREEYPDVICNAEWECDTETTRLVNTNGLDCAYTDTTLSSYIAAEWIRGDDFLSVSDGQTQRDRLDPHDLAQQILQRFHWATRNISAPSGRLPVLFTSKAADLLWDTIHEALSGKRALEQSSPWSDLVGKPVIASNITLSQHPTSGPYSCPFDDEGMPTRQTTFIDQGVLQLFYTDRQIGKQLGSGSTGNGFRPNLESYPSPGLYNSIVSPGKHDLMTLIASLQEGLVVDEVLGGGSGLAGDFSINVALGYYVRGGEILGRVKDTMVCGNVYTALKNAIEIGSDTVWNGSCCTPSIIVDGLSIIGQS